MDWFKLAHFFQPKVTNTIDKKEFINSVDISFHYQENFGNENIKITYAVNLNKRFYELPPDISVEVSDSFLGSGDYIFTLRTAKGPYKRDIFDRLIEFKLIYLSLTSYITQQLEFNLGKEIPIRVESLDQWPMLSYSEKFFQYLYKKYGYYRELVDSDYKKDVYQFEELHKLSDKSRKAFRENPEQFRFSDVDLSYTCSMSLDQIREIIIDHEVPIKVEGRKIIDTIQIRATDFLEAIKAETRRLRSWGRYWHKDRIVYYQSILEILYDSFFAKEKLSLILSQQETYLKKFVVRPGHLIQLKDDRFVLVDSISFNDESDLIVKYSILRNNLQRGKRTRSVEMTEVKYYLQIKYLRQYKSQNVILRIKPFVNWAKKKKRVLEFSKFIPDLAAKHVDYC